MTGCRLRMTQAHYSKLHAHLFPGDQDEHGAVLKAGLVQVGASVRLLVREVHLAQEGIDYVPSRIGYRALVPTFIHQHITSCRDERLVYLAVHNHHSTDSVAFSRVDLHSHERGYPALRDIAAGMPVGALVFGTESVQADIWMPDGRRLELEETVVVGPTVRRLYPRQPQQDGQFSENFDRQIRLMGKQGQRLLAGATIGIIGLGGVGSLVAEYLSRLGVGHLILVDPDEIENTNLSRVVGATSNDVANKTTKIEIAQRVASSVTPAPLVTPIASDVAKNDVAMRLRDCDFIFLAADSMRSRLVFNALVHQYLIPGVQLGAKVARSNDQLEAWSVSRPVRPGQGCLWCNQLIDPYQLAMEAKTDEERKSQAYGVQEPNPSVITLNAVAAAHGVNEFLFDFLSIRPPRDDIEYLHLSAMGNHGGRVEPRVSMDCRECSEAPHSRFAQGDAVRLPTST